MNVYQKLNACRVALQSKDMKKSGNNKFAGYSYFELGDFLPTINKLFAENGLCGVTIFGKEEAALIIYNCDKPEENITFTSPMADAQLKGCHPIQNLGAVQTYQRRYLYMAALEIVEHDALDSSEPVRGKTEGKRVITPSTGVMDSIDPEQQEFLKGLANEVTQCFNDGSINAAIHLLDENHLEAEEKIAVWSLLDSKCRSAIKKAKESAKIADSVTAQA